MDEYTERVISLFTYLKEFSVANQKLVTDIDKQLWHLDFSDIPTYEDYVLVDNRDEEEEDESAGDADSIILSVTKPQMKPCPYNPDPIFSKWLDFNWRDYRVAPKHFELGIETDNSRVETRQEVLDDNPDDVEQFDDDPERLRAYNRWIEKRASWVKEQQPIGAVNDLFTDLYMKYKELEADADTKEFLCGNAFIQLRDKPDVKHPILLKRLKLTYDNDTNTVCVRDTVARPEIYTLLLSSINTTQSANNLVEPAGVNILKNKVEEDEIHPLDRIGVEKLFESVKNLLNPDNEVLSEEETEEGLPSQADTEILISLKPTLFIRKRLNGAINALEKIIEDIKETDEIPQSILDIVGKYSGEETVVDTELTPVQKLAEIGGEDPEILLPLPANREQLEIARRINTESAVLVQGPPGTGKTHTIANLLGNFLAQGKSVLVTSDTRKALSVLKEKVPEELQALCVSLLDENNRDMDKSVDGIVSFQSKYTSFDVKRRMDKAVAERNHLIQELSNTRDTIYKIKFQDFKPIVYQGTNYALIDIAKFVHDNEEKLADLIPGNVVESDVLPLTYDELSALYASNADLSKEEENEIGSGLPDPSGFPSAHSLEETASQLKTITERIKETANSIGYKVQNDFSLVNQTRTIHLGTTTYDDIHRLEEAVNEFKYEDNSWKVKAIIDGKNGGGFAEAWNKLTSLLQDAGGLSDKVYVEQLEHRISLKDSTDISFATEAAEKMCSLFNENGKISGLQRLKNRKYINYIDEFISVNGSPVSTREQCEAVSHYLTLITKRTQIKTFWDTLVAANGGPLFEQLQADFPEQQAIKYIPFITNSLNWYTGDFPALKTIMKNAGLQPEEIFITNTLQTDEENLRTILDTVQHTVPVLSALQREILDYEQAGKTYSAGKQIIKAENNGSPLIGDLLNSYEALNAEEYQSILHNIQYLYNKESVTKQRTKLLQKLNTYAPGWAYAIKTRSGVHGEGSVPSDIADAWKWKQFDKTVKFLNEQSFDELQEKSMELSRRYRNATEEAAKWSAWYHLLKRVEGNKNLSQSLNGWRQTIKRIGKGTGKNAPTYRRIAREQMKICQKAVPVWIMTMNQVFDNLTPGDNRYDVVIVDEASQSNITALSIAYYGAKIIIVGDDKQVSPLAIGMEENKINSLRNTYLCKEIPNQHLYTTRTSLYDIALTTFKPLMLHEHFRCVPEIIGFSNMLSYDNKILPLRDTNSTNLKPAIISYNAQGHRSEARSAKTNIIEQNTVIALLKACFEMPEYKNKTFGVISMLGDRQAEEIQARLSENPEVLEKHKLLFGNSAQFQGDERDVIILTMVDSNENEGPLTTIAEGIDEANKKRYNVAVSRARDQLWIVHSLNRKLDLKDGDIRKTLLNYAESPAQQEQIINAEKRSESPFEKEVALKLTARGYKIVQQWHVGSYRIDMVAMDQNGKVAIECDGEQWHSGAEKIQQDMERQTILERIGWTFIRIRGSEYYSDPEGTIDDVVEDLTRYGIKPYSDIVDKQPDSVLKNKVIERMHAIFETLPTRPVIIPTPPVKSPKPDGPFGGNQHGGRTTSGSGGNTRPGGQKKPPITGSGTKVPPKPPTPPTPPTPKPKPMPVSDINDLYKDLLCEGLKCYLDGTNKRIYVLYEPRTAGTAKKTVENYEGYRYIYKSSDSSPIIDTMSFVIKRKDDARTDYPSVSRDELETQNSQKESLENLNFNNSYLPAQIISEPMFLWLETTQKECDGFKARTLMGRNEEIVSIFTLNDIPELKIEQFYIYVRENRKLYEGTRASAQFKENMMHLWFSTIKEIRIDPKEFERYDRLTTSKNRYGEFTIYKDSEYFDEPPKKPKDVSKKGKDLEKNSKSIPNEELKNSISALDDKFILQMEFSDEERLRTFAKEKSKWRLKLPSSDAYDLYALREIKTILIGNDDETYRCNVECEVHTDRSNYVMLCSVIKRIPTKQTDLNLMEYVIAVKFGLADSGRLIILKRK